MYSSFDVENFPPEAVALLRLLGDNTQPVSVEQMEHHLDLSERSLGRAIRRLVSYHLIQLDYNGAYQLTSRGRDAYKQIKESTAGAEAAPLTVADSTPALTADIPSPFPANPSGGAASGVATNGSNGSTGYTAVAAPVQVQSVTRRLAFVVQPNTPGQPIPILIGVNSPAVDQPQQIGPVSIAIQLNATGCTLSRPSLALDIPIDRAATPQALTATIAADATAARIRADVYQLDDFGDATVIAATYFDLPIKATQTAPRAFGITLTLR